MTLRARHDFTIEFDTANAAFTENEWDGPPECARLLREVADKVEGGQTGGPLLDVNGNRVGRWHWRPQT